MGSVTKACLMLLLHKLQQIQLWEGSEYPKEEDKPTFSNGLKLPEQKNKRYLCHSNFYFFFLTLYPFSFYSRAKL